MGIVVSVKLPECDLVDFEQKLENLLRSYGACINVLTAADGHKLIRAYREVEPAVEVTPNVDVTAAVSAIELPSELPPPPVELPPEPPIEVPQLDTIPVEIPAVEPVTPVPVAPCSGQVYLKDLSTACSVQFTVDTSLECSELKVERLMVVGDYATFAYCGLTFNVPVATSASGSVINNNPQYVGSIRTLCEFVESDADLQPILFKLVEAHENNCCVVFGSDVADIVTRIMEKVPSNDPLSAQ